MAVLSYSDGMIVAEQLRAEPAELMLEPLEDSVGFTIHFRGALVAWTYWERASLRDVWHRYQVNLATPCCAATFAASIAEKWETQFVCARCGAHAFTSHVRWSETQLDLSAFLQPLVESWSTEPLTAVLFAAELAALIEDHMAMVKSWQKNSARAFRFKVTL